MTALVSPLSFLVFLSLTSILLASASASASGLSVSAGASNTKNANDDMSILHTSTTPSSRHLQDVDLSDIDFVFSERRMTLPNYTVSTEFASMPVDVTLYNIVCSNITLGDVRLDWQRPSNQNIDVQLFVQDFDTDCTLDFQYTAGLFLEGAGWAEVATRQSNIAADLQLQSEDLHQAPPSQVLVQSCHTEIYVTNVQFFAESSDFIIGMINNIQDQVKTAMEEEIGARVCQSFGDVDKGISALFLTIAGLLNPYITRSSLQDDPLLAEQNLTVPEHMQLVNFLQSESAIEILMDVAFAILGDYLSMNNVDNDNNNNNNNELIIDGLVRDNLLDSNGILEANVSHWAWDFVDETPLDELAQYNLAPAEFGITALRFDRGAKIRGLDNFVRVDPFRQIGSHTIEVPFTLKEVLIDLYGTIDTLSEVRGAGDDTNNNNDNNTATIVSSELDIALNLTDLDASVTVLVALDETSLGNVRLGNFLTADNGDLTCLLYSLHELRITKVAIHDFVYQPPVVSGLEDDPVLEALINAVLGLGVTMFDSLLADALPELMRDSVEDFLDDYNDIYAPVYNETCVEPPTATTSKDHNNYNNHMDFRDLLLPPYLAQTFGTNGTQPYGSLVPDLKQTVDTSLLARNPETNRPVVNERTMATWTERQSGRTGIYDGIGSVAFQYSRNILLSNVEAQVDLEVSDLYLENLNSFYSPLDILDPVRNLAAGLDNHLTLGDVESPFKVAFVLGVQMGVAGATDADKTKNEFWVEIEMKTLTLVAKILLNLVEKDVIKYPLRDLNQLDCILSLLESPDLDQDGNRVPGSIPPFGVREFDLLMKNVKIDFGCSKCSDIAIRQLVSVMSPVIASIFAPGVDVRFGGNDAESIGIIPYLERLVYDYRDDIRKELDRYLVGSRHQCPSHPDYDPSASRPLADAWDFSGIETVAREAPEENPRGVLAAVCVIASLALLAYLVFHLVLRQIVTRRQKRWLASLPAGQVAAICTRQKQDKAKEMRLNSLCQPILRCDCVPLAVKIGVPVVLVATLALFLCGFLGPAAEVVISANINGVDAIHFTIDYSMSSIVNLTWRAGGGSLAVAATLASGVWPLLKQLLTLVMAMVPPSRIRVATRGKLLLALDMLGKWSMFVVFLNLFNVVAFRSTITSPSDQVLPYKIEVAYVPVWGLYTSFLAQLLSHFVSRTLIHYHRKSVAEVEEKYLVQEQTSQTSSEDGGFDDEQCIRPTNGSTDTIARNGSGNRALHGATFARPHRGEDGRLRVRWFTNLAVVVVAIISIVMLVLGCLLPVYSTQIRGLVSVIQEFGRDFVRPQTSHNVFSIVEALLDQIRFLDTFKHTIGLLSFALFTIIGVVVVPIVLTAALLIQWFYPLRPSWRQKLNAAIEILLSIQYIEVYVVSVIICALQIENLSFYMVNDYCFAFDGMFTNLATYGIIAWEDAQCISMSGSVEVAAILLLTSVLLLNLLVLFVNSAVHQEKMKDFGLPQEKSPSSSGAEDFSSASAKASEIEQLPVLFTDRFRWLLRSDQRRPGGAASPGSPSNLSVSTGPTSLPGLSFDV